jgi:hypothetical protein
MATSTDLRAAIEEVQLALPADIDFDIESFDEKRSLEKLAERLGAMPWWVISSAVHTVIFLLCSLVAVTMPRSEIVNFHSLYSDLRPEKPPEFTPKKRPTDIFETPLTTNPVDDLKNPVATVEPLEPDVQSSDDDVEAFELKGSSDQIGDIPLGSSGVCGPIGLGCTGLPGAFGYRTRGGKRHALGRFGGKGTDSAVEAALRWLARHQEPDGRWDQAKWGGTGSYRRRGDISMTGFAVLAFLGSGYTDQAGKYRDNVRRALHWLLEAQKGGGEKGRFDRCLYTQGIAALALAEAYGMTKDARLREPAQSAIDVIVASQGPYEAWNYTAKTAAGRNDTSVTGWNLMALKSARVAGLTVDGAALQGCMRWLEAATRLSDGRTSYAGTMAAARPGGGSLAMCAAGMLMRQFMGVGRDAEPVKAAAATIDQHQMDWAREDFYYWYYATLCQFQFGGDRWKNWNVNMKKVLLENQRKGGPLDGSADDVDGSWDFENCRIGKRLGRVYTTAMGALCLEVYYRYLPMYGGG